MPPRLIVSSALAAGLLMGASIAFAQDTSSAPPDTSVSNQASAITFPVAELGNCASKSECKAYCDDASHHDACFSFAESHGLMSKAQVQTAKNVISKKGPGECTTRESCQAYCDDSSHTDECLAFAEQNGLIKSEEAAAVREIRKQGGPGQCTTDKECRSYCGDPAHFNECREFARKHNLSMRDEGPREHVETEEFKKKAEALLAEKPGPGGCSGMESCRAYCEDGSHMQECMAFARANGLMSEEEAARAEKFANQTGPGGCRGSECRTYCEDVSHQEACIAFAKENGFIDEERAEKVREFASFSGPGGCKGEECRTFCDDPSHREECHAFAQKQGFGRGPENRMSGERTEGMPPREVNGEARPFSGPGGCTTREECESYCTNNPEACGTFQQGMPPGGFGSEGFEGMMPGDGRMPMRPGTSNQQDMAHQIKTKLDEQLRDLRERLGENASKEELDAFDRQQQELLQRAQDALNELSAVEEDGAHGTSRSDFKPGDQRGKMMPSEAEMKARMMGPGGPGPSGEFREFNSMPPSTSEGGVRPPPGTMMSPPEGSGSESFTGSTPPPPPPTPPPSTMGAAIITAFLNLFQFTR